MPEKAMLEFRAEGKEAAEEHITEVSDFLRGGVLRNISCDWWSEFPNFCVTGQGRSIPVSHRWLMPSGDGNGATLQIVEGRGRADQIWRTPDQFGNGDLVTAGCRGAGVSTGAGELTGPGGQLRTVSVRNRL
jgi:hypothetical protein